MNGQAWYNDLPHVASEMRAELVRLGITKADFDRNGISLDDLNREALRMFRSQQCQLAELVRALLERVGLAPPLRA
jgi:hypothetical protein